jgi:tetratricopeptide (TPR) repeat protein
MAAVLGSVAYLVHKMDKAQMAKEKNQQKERTSHRVTAQKHLPVFLFFSLWFAAGMVMLLQIVPLDMTVADRWFYFPIIGMLGIIGSGMQAIPGQLGLRKLWVVGAVILVSVLSLRTFVRTVDWKDNLTPYAHDYREADNNYMLAGAYATELMYAGKDDEAIVYATKSVSLHPTVVYLNILGLAYQHKQQYDEAIAAYTRGVQLAEGSSATEARTKSVSMAVYTNLPVVLLINEWYEEAVKFIRDRALQKHPDSAPSICCLRLPNTISVRSRKRLPQRRKRIHCHRVTKVRRCCIVCNTIYQ